MIAISQWQIFLTDNSRSFPLDSARKVFYLRPQIRP
jgi:hypothetical protein